MFICIFFCPGNSLHYFKTWVIHLGANSIYIYVQNGHNVVRHIMYARPFVSIIHNNVALLLILLFIFCVDIEMRRN